jgi:Na+-translocating ferredoxin:NAD+ oxidoreductase RnfA subunit
VWGWSFIIVSTLFLGGMLAPRWRARHFTQHLLVGILAGLLIALLALWVLLLLLAKMDPAGVPISTMGVTWPMFTAVAISMSWSRFGWGRQ